MEPVFSCSIQVSWKRMTPRWCWLSDPGSSPHVALLSAARTSPGWPGDSLYSTESSSERGHSSKKGAGPTSSWICHLLFFFKLQFTLLVFLWQTLLLVQHSGLSHVTYPQYFYLYYYFSSPIVLPWGNSICQSDSTWGGLRGCLGLGCRSPHGCGEKMLCSREEVAKCLMKWFFKNWDNIGL